MPRSKEEIAKARAELDAEEKGLLGDGAEKDAPPDPPIPAITTPVEPGSKKRKGSIAELSEDTGAEIADLLRESIKLSRMQLGLHEEKKTTKPKTEEGWFTKWLKT